MASIPCRVSNLFLPTCMRVERGRFHRPVTCPDCIMSFLQLALQAGCRESACESGPDIGHADKVDDWVGECRNASAGS